MSAGRFSLIPFPAAGEPLEIEISGAISRRAGTLVLRYDLSGGLAGLAIPPPAKQPARRQGLWQETCFEFFLGLRKEPAYWEFNLSPAGHWNVYRFSGYRQGGEEEAAFAALPFSVRQSAEALRLTLEIDLARIVPPTQPLEVGLSAVIQPKAGAATHWALRHPGSRPDFHTRQSFIILL